MNTRGAGASTWRYQYTPGPGAIRTLCWVSQVLYQLARATPSTTIPIAGIWRRRLLLWHRQARRAMQTQGVDTALPSLNRRTGLGARTAGRLAGQNPQQVITTMGGRAAAESAPSLSVADADTMLGHTQPASPVRRSLKLRSLLPAGRAAVYGGGGRCFATTPSSAEMAEATSADAITPGQPLAALRYDVRTAYRFGFPPGLAVPRGTVPSRWAVSDCSGATHLATKCDGDLLARWRRAGGDPVQTSGSLSTAGATLALDA